MRRILLLLLLLLLALTLPVAAQTTNQWSLTQMFGFEYGFAGGVPAGWNGSQDGTTATDCTVAHGGRCSARLTRNSSSAGTYSYLQTAATSGFSGKTLQWSGWIRTSGVNGYAAIFFGTEDANFNAIGFASTQGQGFQGTRNWTQFSVTLPVTSQTSTVYMGFLMGGTGTAWFDDVQLTLDGRPVAPALPASFTSDTQFDNGSGINIASLTDIQVRNLAVLAKVWGFLKYYHPSITGGKNNWDYDLFRVLPGVLGAGDTTTANQAIADWIGARLGTVGPCSPCANLDTGNLYLGTHLDWLADTSLLGTSVSRVLQSVYANRTPQSRSFYVSLVNGANNPAFQFESVYPGINLDSGYQLLALFRAWNAVEYFYPNRDIMADDPAGSPNYWDDVLKQSIPEVATASNFLAFEQAILKFKANIHDTHTGISNFNSARPPLGNCSLPVQVRFVEGSPVVTNYLSANGANSGLQVGDAIQQLDGVAASDLVAQWVPYYTASNQAARLRDIGNAFTFGSCGPASVVVLRGLQQVGLTSARVANTTLDFTSNGVDDRPGPTFQMLTPDIAYLKLSSVVAAQSASYVQAAAGTKAMIIDIRNYPSEFVVFTLGGLLVSQPTNFAQFTHGDVTTPGIVQWGQSIGLTPAQPHYNGKIVLLVNEITQSQAEYTSMAFRSVPGALVVGSTTAGADGNVSPVQLPGGLFFYFSGLGVYYPDHHPTQRVGIIPNVVVTPTIAGIRAGRDEVLEAAMALIDRTPRRKPASH